MALSALLAGFEWPVARRYRIIEDAPRRPRTVRLPGGKVIRQKPTLLEDPDNASPLAGKYLVADGRVSLRRPLDVVAGPPLHCLLLAPLPLETVVLDVAPRCGMLTKHSNPEDREPLAVWQNLIDDLRAIAANKTLRSGYVLDPGSRLRVAIDARRRRRTGSSVVLLPENMRDGIKLQLVSALADGQRVFACEQCGAWTANTRRTARFCSDRCRTAHHNARRLALRARTVASAPVVFP